FAKSNPIVVTSPMDGSHSLLFRSDSSLALRCRKGAIHPIIRSPRRTAGASSPPCEPRFAIERRSTSNEPSPSNHRVPRRRDEPVPAAGLLDVAEAGEREVIARDQELIGRSHVVDAPARRHGLLR